MSRVFQIFILLALFTQKVFSQELPRKYERQIDKADFLFESFVYIKAIEKYKKALKISDQDADYPSLKIADAYRLINENQQSLDWYRRVQYSDIMSYRDKSNFAQVLIENGLYEEAKQVADSLNTTLERLDRADQVNLIKIDTAAYFLRNLEINSEQGDFSPTYYEDGIVFVSNREFSRLVQIQKYYWDNSFYLDLYYFQDVDSTQDYLSRFSQRINTIYHEGPCVFYDNNTKLIFTRNNFEQGRKYLSEEGINKLQLYYSERDTIGAKWAKPSEMPFNSDEYSVGHPTLTSDASRLYFSSDMPDGFGEADIYYSDFKEGQWTDPVNVGNRINTEEDELFPFIYQDSILIFASKGHLGLGGLDLYSVNLNDPASRPVNMGVPLNSDHDDFGLVMKENSGYFSSNRPGGKGGDDIYSFIHTPIGDIYISGIVIDESERKPVAGAQVMITSPELDTIWVNSDEEGRFRTPAHYMSNYMVAAHKSGYTSLNRDSTIANITEGTVGGLEIRLYQNKHVVEVKAIDMLTGEFIPEATVWAQETESKDTIPSTQTPSGVLYFGMIEEMGFQASAYHHSYFANSVLHVIPDGYGQDTLRLKVPLEKIEIGKAIELENIYYDVNKSDIRPDAAIELNKLVKILVDNPAIKIELSSHTDSRGSDSYNMALSQRRAESAVQYIISQGISAKRITAKGYGETRLVNKCRNGVSCSSEQHQANRRTEFAVTEID